MTIDQLVSDLNELIRFLAYRNIAELSKEAFENKYGKKKIETLVLAGNGLPYTSEVIANSYRQGLVDKIILTGGVGHTTDLLRKLMANHPIYQKIDATNKSEAELFQEMLVQYESIPATAIFIETTSTNGGENAMEARKVIESVMEVPEEILLIQDPTMQRRADACFRKYFANTKIINYAPFIPLVEKKGMEVCFKETKGVTHWEMPRFLSLVMGEFPRLADTPEGYGPNGQKFQAYVKIPYSVEAAYLRIKERYPTVGRK